MEDRRARFRKLFDAGYGPLHDYARRRCSATDVDDVVAETLTIAWRRLDDIPEHAQLPWLYGVARRVLANQRRGADRRLRLVTRLTAEPPSRPSDGGDDDGVLLALARLRPDDREVLRLAAWEQLGPSDIAVVLGCTPNAAALRLSRARRRLRDELTGTNARRTPTERKVADA